VELRVRYAGVPIGTLTLAVPSGLAHGQLAPGAGYELAREQVESAGRLLAPRGIGARVYWAASRGDFADAVSTLTGGYELEDLRGMRVAAASVVVFAPPGSEANQLWWWISDRKRHTCLPSCPRPAMRAVVDAALLPNRPLQQTKPRSILRTLKHHACGLRS
jgi:hypothetical protein